MPFYFQNGVHCAGGGVIGEGVGGLLFSAGLHASLVGILASLASLIGFDFGGAHCEGDGDVEVVDAVVSFLMPNGKIMVLGIVGSFVPVGM